MTRSLIVGAITGAIILGALWAFAGNFVHGVGTAGASLLSQWLGGSVMDNDPLIAYRWGSVGIAVGGFLGGCVGAICKNMEGRAGGILIGTLVAATGLVLSVLILALTTGTEVLSELGVAPTLIGVITIILAGSIIGAAVQFCLRGLGLSGKV